MFRGSYTALTTPFINNRFDEAAFEKQIAFQAKNGTQGIIPVGTTGESPTLSHEEHRRVFEVAVAAARGTGMKVLAGTGSNATEEALELTQFAKKIGCDGALMVNPYYNKPTQEGLYRHFKYIAERVDLPIVLYNIPGRTGVTMTVATTAKLARDFPTIVGVKEATGSLDQCSETVISTRLTVMSGDDSITVPMMSVGAAGVISVASNIMPAEIREMVDAAARSDFVTARAIHGRLFNLFKALFIETNPIGIKTAMQLLGRDTGELRLPMCEASHANRLTIRQALVNVGLLAEGQA